MPASALINPEKKIYLDNFIFEKPYKKIIKCQFYSTDEKKY